MDNISKINENQTYRIGAVSRLTGVAQDTLRVWERRYGTVVPTRSKAGRRIYSQDDISRLTLIKRLVDRGDAISSVANLTLEQLQARVTQAGTPTAMASMDEPYRLALLGDIQANKLASELRKDEGLVVTALHQDKERFLEEVSGLEVDLIILEYSTLMPVHVKEIGELLQKSGATRALIVYGFSNSPTLAQLESERIIPLRMPVAIPEIRRLCHTLHARPEVSSMSTVEGVELSGDIPPRRYNDAELAKVAAASVSVRCECPHHLVDIIASLSAFEEYSQQCEILNGDDAALHAMLHAATARARSIIEASLERVIEIDGIDLAE
ncbi:MAG: MerR family transcriptional regulator [Candidatus Thiodiazotropha sp.]